MPRTFRLYDELEKAEHAKLSDQSVSYGLDKGKQKKIYFNYNGLLTENINKKDQIFKSC